jgi:hypothetical protein
MYKWPRSAQKMLNINIYNRNTNQIHDMSWITSFIEKITNSGKDTRKEEI